MDMPRFRKTFVEIRSTVLFYFVLGILVTSFLQGWHHLWLLALLAAYEGTILLSMKARASNLLDMHNPYHIPRTPKGTVNRWGQISNG